MGTIVPRKRADGSTAFLARIRIKQDGKVVYSESETFDKRHRAETWAEDREKALAKPGALELAMGTDPPFGAVIHEYVKGLRKEPGRTKKQVLNAVQRYPIAKLKCSQVTCPEVCKLIDALSETVQPQTVQNYLMHIRGVFKIARRKWNYPLDEKALDDARIVAKEEGKVGKAKERDRRPTIEEIDRLIAHFIQVRIRRPESMPMPQIIVFAMFSTRRQEEITTIRWPDLEQEPRKRVLVRDMKHPGEKVGNNVWCDLPDEAMRVITSMPRPDGRIFPYDAGTISTAFTRACKFLGIEDLHFHDLRHEGISRLFEMGETIPHVAAVSGHRSWNSLKRYTQLQQRGDKWKGWSGLDLVCPSHKPRLLLEVSR